MLPTIPFMEAVEQVGNLLLHVPDHLKANVDNLDEAVTQPEAVRVDKDDEDHRAATVLLAPKNEVSILQKDLRTSPTRKQGPTTK